MQILDWDGMTAPEPPQPHPVCTFIPGRSPQFKMHSSLGLAKNAIAYKTQGGRLSGGVVYSLAMTCTGPHWIVAAVIAPGTKKDEHPFFRSGFQPYHIIDERP